MPVTFALQAQPTDAVQWQALARRAEAAGFVAFLVADHPGSSASPFVALAAAASVTESIALGTYVVNAGVREPLHIAADVATLDVCSGGRALLGIGAGHTPAEWTMIGRERPPPAARVEQMIECVDTVVGLLAGEMQPRPIQARIPLLIGGGNARLVRYAAEHADIVGISGLGRTLADGHTHEVRWRADAIERTIALIRESGREPVIDALVQHVEITDDRFAAAEKLARDIPYIDADDLLACPFVLIGTEAQLRDEVHRHRDRWGITRFTVRANALDAVARLIA